MVSFRDHTPLHEASVVAHMSQLVPAKLHKDLESSRVLGGVGLSLLILARSFQCEFAQSLWGAPNLTPLCVVSESAVAVVFDRLFLYGPWEIQERSFRSFQGFVVHPLPCLEMSILFCARPPTGGNRASLCGCDAAPGAEQRCQRLLDTQAQCSRNRCVVR